MKRLVIIQDIHEARAFLKLYRNYSEWKTHELVLFAPDVESFQFLQSTEDLNPIESSAYDDTSKQTNVSSTAYDLASNWTDTTGRKNTFIYRNISLPLIIQREMTYFWVGLLRTIHVFNELCLQAQPNEVWICKKTRPDLFFYAPSNYAHFSHVARACHRTMDRVREFDLSPSESVSAAGESSLRKLLFYLGRYWTRQELKRTPRLQLRQFSALLKDFATAVSCLFFRLVGRKNPAQNREGILISSSPAHIKTVINAIKETTEFPVDYLREVFAPRQAMRMLKEDITFRHFQRSSYTRTTQEKSAFTNINVEECEEKEFEDVNLISAAFQKLNFLTSDYFNHIANLIDSAYDFLGKYHYLGIAGEEDVCVFNKVLFEVARQKQIRSVVVQHGAVGLPIGFVPLSASYFAAWGEFSKNRLVAWGVPENRVVVTGNPAYDKLREDTLKPRTAELAARYGIDMTKPALLVAMFPFRDYSSTDFPEVCFSRESYVESLKEIINGLKAFHQYQVVLKLHPRDSGLKKCERILQESGESHMTLVQEGNIAEWAPLCRAAVSFFSSSVIDLIASRTPLIMLDITGDVERTKTIFPVEVPVVPAEAGALSAALSKILESGSNSLNEATVSKHVYKLDGKSANRVAALLCGGKIDEDFAGNKKESCIKS